MALTTGITPSKQMMDGMLDGSKFMSEYLPLSHGKADLDIRENGDAYIFIEYGVDFSDSTEAAADACTIREILSRMISLKSGTVISTAGSSELLNITWRVDGTSVSTDIIRSEEGVADAIKDYSPESSNKIEPFAELIYDKLEKTSRAADHSGGNGFFDAFDEMLDDLGLGRE